MNREIKFRAWDGIRMILPEDNSYLAITARGEVCELAHSGYDNDEQSHDDWVPMQYTGLKDSKGKEIYEGDILAKSPNSKERVVITYRQFSDEFTTGVGFVWDWTLLDPARSLIIGNIYSNPELLK